MQISNIEYVIPPEARTPESLDMRDLTQQTATGWQDFTALQARQPDVGKIWLGRAGCEACATISQ